MRIMLVVNPDYVVQWPLHRKIEPRLYDPPMSIMLTLDLPRDKLLPDQKRNPRFMPQIDPRLLLVVAAVAVI